MADHPQAARLNAATIREFVNHAVLPGLDFEQERQRHVQALDALAALVVECDAQRAKIQELETEIGAPRLSAGLVVTAATANVPRYFSQGEWQGRSVMVQELNWAEDGPSAGPHELEWMTNFGERVPGLLWCPHCCGIASVRDEDALPQEPSPDGSHPLDSDPVDWRVECDAANARATAAEDEAARYRDRAVCSGCGQDVNEGGACETRGCWHGEMIPSSDLPSAFLAALRDANDITDEIRARIATLEQALAEVESELRMRASVVNEIGQIEPPYTAHSLLSMADLLARAVLVGGDEGKEPDA